MNPLNENSQMKKIIGVGIFCLACFLALPARADVRLVTTIDVGFHDHGTPVSQKHSPPGFPARVMLFSLR